MKKRGENADDYLPAQQLYATMYEPIVNNASTNPVYGSYKVQAMVGVTLFL
ncbi:MAG TPA: hypothetical protein PLR06_08930 [Cyclobacteriaceae bacterium]|nr:hypothetical protein [Cyclobacteriaceae bacterium]